MTNKFSKLLIDRIKKEKIQKTPKYIFIVKNIFIWFILLFSLALGSISLSISLGYLINADWYLFQIVGLIKVISVFSPLFWIIIIILTTFFTYYNYRNTEKGYKIGLLKIFFINIVISIVLALLLQFIGFNIYIESKLEKHIPQYRSFLVDDRVSRMIQIWQNENKGLLIGKILIIGNSHISFKDFNNKTWKILLDNEITTDIKHRVIIKSGEKIKIIGEKISQNEFKAIQIRPFLGKGRNKNINNKTYEF